MNGTFVPGIGHLSVAEVYLALNEPMLFSARNELGDFYFVSYADMTDDGESWIMTRVSNERLMQYELGHIDTRMMFLESETGTTLLVEYSDIEGHRPKLSYYMSTDVEMQQYLSREGQRNPSRAANSRKVHNYYSSTLPPKQTINLSYSLEADIRLMPADFSTAYPEGILGLSDTKGIHFQANRLSA